MSDTPRTDESEKDAGNALRAYLAGPQTEVLRESALIDVLRILLRESRQLERELRQAKQDACFWEAFADPPDMKTGETIRSRLEREKADLQREVARLLGIRLVLDDLKQAEPPILDERSLPSTPR